MPGTRSFYINEQGDLEFDGLGRLKTVEGSEAVAQRLRVELSTRQGEWFLNTLFGVPWLDIFGKQWSEARVRKEILRVLNNDAAVDEVIELTIGPLDREQRYLPIAFTVRLDSGALLSSELEVQA